MANTASGYRGSRPRCLAPLITILFLQALLWPSLFVLSSTIFLFIDGSIDPSMVVPESLYIGASATTLLYLAIYSISAYLQDHPLSAWTHRILPRLRWLCCICIRVVAIVWLGTCGLDITYTVAREPLCNLSGRSSTQMWMEGRTCIIQRSALAGGLLSLTVSIALPIVLVTAHDPFAAGLFTYRQPSRYLSSSSSRIIDPFADKESLLTSSLSFKCRSSSSLTLKTSSSTRELSKAPAYPVGLGIQISPIRPNRCPFLSARPSVASIRSASTPYYYAATRPEPHLPPLPPVPAHLTPRYRPSDGHYQHSNNPDTTAKPIGSVGHTILPPTKDFSQHLQIPGHVARTALTSRNLAAWSSVTSLSSVYSRSVSGDGKENSGPDIRSAKDACAVTGGKAPLRAMKQVEQPDVFVYDVNGKKTRRGDDGIAGLVAVRPLVVRKSAAV